jgi:serine/threonine-protein kinase
VIGETLSNRFRIVRLLGRGGMSAVWLAEDSVLDRQVAVKLLHARRLESEDAVERFEREARTLASLAHPGIVTVIDRGEHDGRPFIVFEYVPGSDLRTLIAEQGPLEPVVALTICREVADALGYAHAHGVIHRDVKPHNVLLTLDGHAKLTDFGIARILEEPSLTSTGRVLGTGEYLAPEQAAGRALDGRTDVYALGVMLYQCLTGETPYRGESFVEIAEQHLRSPVPQAGEHVEDLPEGVDRVLAKALAKRPEDRYASCAELSADLERLLTDQPHERLDDTAEIPVVSGIVHPPAPLFVNEPLPMPVPPHHAPPPRRQRLAYGVLLGAVLVIGGGWAAYLLLGTGGSNAGTTQQAITTGPPTNPSTASVGKTPGSGSQLVWIRFVDARAFDPLPLGDGQEDDPGTHYAIDGNPATAWSTETYHGSIDANHKGGVGLILDAGKAVDASQLKLTVPVPGWSGRIYTANTPTDPTSLTGFKPASKQFTIGTTTKVVPLHTDPARLFLVWITQLTGPPNDWSAEIAEAQLFGPRES